MATRFYFPLTEAAPVTPLAADAVWDLHVQGTGRKLLTVVDSSALTTTAYTPDGADHTVGGLAHHRSYVSDPIAAQTIDGNVKFQFQATEPNVSCNQFLYFCIKVISNNGTVERAILLTGEDFTEIATALTNRQIASEALTAYTCIAGDRLQIEIGVGGMPTSGGGTNGHNASIRWGCSAAGGDLPENDSDTGTTLRPWVEFSNTITFGTTFTQTVGGYSENPTGDGPTTTSKRPGAYSENPTGAMNRQTSKTIGGYAENPTAAVTNQTSKTMGNYSENPLGALATAICKVITVGAYSENPTGVLTRSITKVQSVGNYSQLPTSVLIFLTSKNVGGFALDILGDQMHVISKTMGNYSEAPTANLTPVFIAGGVTYYQVAGDYGLGLTSLSEYLTAKNVGDAAVDMVGALDTLYVHLAQTYSIEVGHFALGQLFEMQGGISLQPFSALGIAEVKTVVLRPIRDIAHGTPNWTKVPNTVNEFDHVEQPPDYHDGDTTYLRTKLEHAVARFELTNLPLDFNGATSAALRFVWRGANSPPIDNYTQLGFTVYINGVAGTHRYSTPKGITFDWVLHTINGDSTWLPQNATDYLELELVNEGFDHSAEFELQAYITAVELVLTYYARVNIYNSLSHATTPAYYPISSFAQSISTIGGTAPIYAVLPSSIDPDDENLPDPLEPP